MLGAGKSAGYQISPGGRRGCKSRTSAVPPQRSGGALLLAGALAGASGPAYDEMTGVAEGCHRVARANQEPRAGPLRVC
jgi:hypothetical protein